MDLSVDCQERIAISDRKVNFRILSCRRLSASFGIRVGDRRG